MKIVYTTYMCHFWNFKNDKMDVKRRSEVNEMALQFIIGKAGAGKSYRLHQMMIESAKQDENKNFIAVVPEQYSLETQKEILEQHEKHGSFQIEVTSFYRLAYAVFEEQGYSGFQVMDDLGKTLVMRKVLLACGDDLVIYRKKADNPGFAEKMKSVLSELKQYGISGETLEQMMEEVDSPALTHKLKDIQVIYDAFESYIQEKMITTEDVLSQLCKYIATSELIKKSSFYFDGFTGFTPVQYQVLELLLKYAKDVVVAVTLPEREESYWNYEKTEVFALSKETLVRLSELAERNGVNTKEMIVVGKEEVPYRIRENEELCFVEKHLFQKVPAEPMKMTKDSILFCEMKDPYGEVVYVASKISELVSKRGYRYNDFAIITGAMENYYRYVDEIFEKYDIPVFIDHKRSIANNPFVDGILAAIEIVEQDFSFDSVLRFLRLGVCDIERTNVDLLENYVLRSGKRGYKSYSQNWTKLYRNMDEVHLTLVNEARETLKELMEPFRKALKKKNATVEDYTRAVYDFVVATQMQRKMDDYTVTFQQQGNLSKEKEYQQTYEEIIGMFDQLVQLLGSATISVKEYQKILETGFETIKVGIIPPGMDTVMVGDIQRTRLKDTKKVLFVLGTNDGIIPKAAPAGSVITDRERELLGERNYALAPTARESLFQQRLYLYSLFAKPTEQIYLCYHKISFDRKSARPSYLISEVSRLFEKVPVIRDEQKQITAKSISNPGIALEYIAENIRDFGNKKMDQEFLPLCVYMNGEAKTKEFMDKICQGAFYQMKEPKITEEIAKRMYEHKENIGITQIERFAGCGYQFFLNDGLKLRERDVFRLAAFDIGNLYHGAIDAFFKEVERQKLDWRTIEKEQGRTLIGQCVEQVVNDYENDMLDTSSRSDFIKKQVKTTAECTVDTLIRHIKSGKFQPAEYELRVAHGRIDRVDVMEKEDKLYVKVIDYKSGSTKFDIQNTFLGLQLQLMIYLKDAVRYEQTKHPDKSVVPAGGLYFHIDHPYVDKPISEKTITDESIRREVLEASVEELKYETFRMTGLVNSHPDVISSMDHDLAGMTKGKSKILPVEMKGEELSDKSHALDTEHLEGLMEYVSGLAEDMQEQIFKGDISLNPIEEACTYCKFGGICGFDRKLGSRFREKEKWDWKKVKEYLEKKDEENGDEVDR
ncbi:MAG: exodeoxyribonuclease V subunit gamma [Eubacterium sp.]|nr:exodeoxyribonuclease V subunit gamma [Eubacterium sp.]